MKKIDPSAVIAEGAKIIDNVELGANTTILYNAVLRGDDSYIVIGDNSNIQDNAMVHCSPGQPTIVGKGTTVGHLALLHACTIGDNTLIGMGSIIMNGAKIGSNCIIGAGSLVTKDMVIPDNSMAFGSPARIRRQVTEAEIESNRHDCEVYLELNQKMREEAAKK